MEARKFSWGRPPGYYRDETTRKRIFVSGAAQFIRSDREAELNAAAQLRALGYRDAVATRGGPDGGIDVWSSRALAQVKCRAEKAGQPDLQRLYGARGNDHEKELWFFVSSGYTKLALEYADQVSIFLFTYSATGELTPVNELAKEKLTQLLADRAKRIVKWRTRRRTWHTRFRDQPPSSAIAELAELLGPSWTVTLTPAALSSGTAGAFPVLDEVS